MEKRFACVRSRSAVRPSRRLPRERTELQTMFRSCIRLPGDADACFRLPMWACKPLTPGPQASHEFENHVEALGAQTPDSIRTPSATSYK